MAVSDERAGLVVQRQAREGDRVRRTVAALRLAARVAPSVGAVALLATVASALVGGSRLVGPALLVCVALVGGALLWMSRRARPVTDQAAQALDAAAGLGGALRSALWFADQPAGESRQSEDPRGAWVQHHVATAAVRVADVDWAHVFPRPRARGAWTTAVACVVATAAVSLTPASFVRGGSAARAIAAGAADEAAATIPVALMPQLVEGMRAMKSGQKLSKESLAAIGQALEIAKGDERLQSALANMFADAGQFPDNLQGGFLDFDQEDYEMRGGEMVYTGEKTMALALEWAYKQAESRQAAADKSGESGGEDPEQSAAGGEGEANSEASSEAGLSSISPNSPGVPASDQAATFSSLLFGRQPSGGDGKGAPPQPARSAALTLAMQREIIHADRDLAGQTGAPTGLRRTTNARPSGGDAVLAQANTAYDRSRSTRPPAVPEERRPLVHDFFTRPAEPAASDRQP